MILNRNADGTYTLPDGTIIDEAAYQAQLTNEDKAKLGGNPPAPPPNAEVPNLAEIQNLILQEENRKMRELLAARNTPAPSNPPAEPQLAPGAFFNEPDKAMAAINTLLERQVAPLRDFMADFKKQQAYGALKNQVRARFPQFTQIEGLVDQFMEGVEPTEANFTAAVQRAIGAAVVANPNFLSGNNNSTPNQPANAGNTPKPPVTNPPVITPPHLAPSPARNLNNSGNDAPDMSQFDENAKRLMRENGMGPREFILLRDTPPNELTKASFQKKLEDARKADRGA